ncbi:MAG: FAD-binding protein [Planctomycetes bacterium]|nr:FAD-binding protein [Planctomycetota bacterium]
MKTTRVTFKGKAVPVTATNTVIIGAGAAAMNCAVKLVEFWQSLGVADAAEKLLVVTGGLPLGASRMSGSDKQTYYKMGTSPRVPDTAVEFAKALTGFGCCHGDNALAEGIGSLRGFYHLVEVGVPFPHDPWGAFIGYKTDHDPYERATSAGPKTSKFMSECLQKKAARLGVRIVDKHPLVRLITEGSGDKRRIRGALCIDRQRARGDDPGLAVFVAENFVLAAGGPGEVYRTTVYPRGQYGIHAAALEAGLVACNLTESQYGLASTKFRWNVSGTYMQVVPRIYSTDASGGDQREFLVEYFPDMKSMATNVFLKGYQWPFDAQRIVDHQSTLVDMAVHVETVVRGRRVFMDFLRNPVGAEGWDEFRIDDLGPEALDYLQKTGALQALPIERLEHMNPPAIEIYAENGIDLKTEPLEIAVCAQHMNGGFAVSKWWESSLPHTFVIGEMAGTHGVKRPGGSALNAGQVGASRTAEYITHVYGNQEPDESAAAKVAEQGLKDAALVDELLSRRATAKATCDEVMAEIGDRMTRYGAHLRSRKGAAAALDAAKAQYARLRKEGVKFASAEELPMAVTVVQQCLTQVALLKAICAMFERGAGSRGSHCILDPDGTDMHPKLVDPETGKPFRFVPENEALRNEIVQLWFDAKAADLFAWNTVAPRPLPERQIAFEPAWTEYREGKIYEL